MVAAKTMTLTAMDLFTDPQHIVKARADFEKARGPNFKYTTRLAGRKPALRLADKSRASTTGNRTE